MGAISYLSLLKSSRVWSWLVKLAGWVLLLFRKKVFFGAAVFTTFKQTFSELYLLLRTGESSLGEVGSVFVNDVWNKFLGAAPSILQGLNDLQSGELVSGFLGLWTGVASVYMIMFLYFNVFRGKVQNSEVEWPEKAKFLLIWVLGSALVHGPSVWYGIVEQAGLLADSVAEFTGLNEGVNGTSVNSSEMVNTTS